MSKVSDLHPVAKRVVIYPNELEHRLGISPVTRWRRERAGLLPKRDFFVGGKAEGWFIATIEASEKPHAA